MDVTEALRGELSAFFQGRDFYPALAELDKLCRKYGVIHPLHTDDHKTISAIRSELATMTNNLPTLPAHSKYGASKAHRWMNCPGSARAEASVEAGNTPVSAYAEEGRFLHEVAEARLTGRPTPAGVTDDQMELVNEYGAKIKEIMQANPGAQITIERKFHLRHLHPMLFGTADCVIFAPPKLYVVDFKTGGGVRVEAKNPDGSPNIQTAYYALGAYLDFPPDYRKQIKTVELVIVQPKLGPPSSTVLSVMEITEIGMELVSGIERAEKPDAPFVAGHWCKFCRAATHCPALKQVATEAARVAFADLGKRDTEPLDVSAQDWDGAAMADLLPKVAILENFVKEVKRVALAGLLHGHKIPGYKAVAGRGRRVYENEAHVLQALEIQLGDRSKLFAPAKILSPAQMEKLLKAEGISDGKALINRFAPMKPGAPTITTEHDPRPALTPGDYFKGVMHDESED